MEIGRHVKVVQQENAKRVNIIRKCYDIADNKQFQFFMTY